MKPVFTLLLLLAAMTLPAQDFHFSEYTNASLQLNPALTGFIPGGASSRVQATYRDQWISALGGGSFKTAAASYDHRFCGNYKDGYGSFGLSVFTNLRGENAFQTSGFTFSGAYTRKLGGTNRYPTLITLAAEGGATLNALVPRDRTFDAQFDDPDNPGEFLQMSSPLTPDLGVGLFISKSIIDRAKSNLIDGFNLGIALKHVNRPIFRFLDPGQAETTRLPIRTNAHLSFVKGFAQRSLNVLLIYTYQQPFSMFYGRGMLTFRSDQPTQYAIGLGLRVNNDFTGIGSESGVLTAQVRKEAVNFSLTYDVNFNQLSDATRGGGAFEVSAGFYFGAGGCVECPFGF